MRIRSIRLSNYRKYRSLDIELPDGMISIIGPNGAGKSTLMEAVAWALFGNETEIVRTDKVSIKRQGAPHTDECLARIEFDYEDTTYIVERSMRGKNLTMDAELRAGDQLIAHGTEDVTAAVAKLFGMDHKSFFISVFARQKELNALTSQPKGERKKIVLRMLGIENVDVAIARIREDKRAAEDGVKSARKDLTDPDGTSAIERMESELEGFGAQEIALKAAKSELESELKKMESVHRKLKKELDSQERMAKERNALLAKTGALNARLDELRIQGKRAKAEIDKLAAVEKEFLEQEPKAAKASEELESILGKREAAQKEKDGLRSEMGGLKVSSRQLEKEMKDIQTGMAEIEDMGPESDCPTCKRKLGDTYSRLLQDYQDQLKERQKRLKASEKQFAADEAALAECDARLEALSKREARLKAQVNSLEMLKSKLEHSAGQRDHLAELEAKMESAEAERRKAQESLEGLSFDQETFERSRAAAEGLNQQLRDIDRKLHDRDTEIVRIEEKRIAGAREMERLKALEKKVAEKLARAELLAELERVMANFRIHLISRIRPALASISSELLGVLTDGRYTELELGEDYDISVRDGGVPFDLERFSGGEKDLANLCLRLAISEIISTRHGTTGFDMIVLDEIFGSQDANRKRALLTTLNGLSNRFKQIFLITHVEDVKELMGNVIEVSEAQDGTSSAAVLQ